MAFSIHFQEEHALFYFNWLCSLRIIGFAWKFVFGIKFACASLAARTSAVNLFNSGVEMYLSWLWTATFYSVSLNLDIQSVLLTKILTSCISFSTAVNAEVVVKPTILGILLSISLILAL